MKRAYCAAGVAALLLMPPDLAVAQQEIQWKQTVNTPKGLNLPNGLAADILGIAPGDSYTEAKAKIEQIKASTADSRPLQENKIVFRLPTASGFLTASYVGELHLERSTPGKTQQKIDDNITVRLSAPSSGHQVLGLKRIVTYNNQADEPRISELLALLKDKFKVEPQKVSNFAWRVQFNDGRAVAAKNFLDCPLQYTMNNSADVRTINRNGDCDVALEITVQYGKTNDHARRVDFILSDNERTKANVGADFAFFDAYVRNLQSTKGAAPKL